MSASAEGPSRRHAGPLLGAALAGLLLLQGCTAVSVTKAGAQDVPVTLRMGTDDGPGRPAADQIEHFAREVADRSGGRVVIKPVWRAVGAGQDDWDQKVARKVVAGDLDLATVPSRAWDTEGVTSLRALNAPMLVTSDDLVARIATGELAATMLGGLDKAGVVGLALLPEGIRRVFWFDSPRTSPDAMRGAHLRVPASATTYATFEALGVRPDDSAASPEAIKDGLVDGAETSFQLVGSLPSAHTSVVGNMPLWPKMNSLVVNRKALAELPTDLQDVLREAAAATTRWAVEHSPSDPDAAASYCASGGTIVQARQAEVDAFRRATQSVTDQLKADATTRQLIEAIEALKGRAAPEGVTSCTPPAPAPARGAAPGPLSGPGNPGDLPQGTFRYQFSPEELRAAGLSEGDVRLNAGLYTWTLTEGRWKYVLEPTFPLPIDSARCAGFYDVAGEQVTFTTTTKIVDGDCAPTAWTARWAKDSDTLTWNEVSVPDFAPVWSAHPWQRVN